MDNSKTSSESYKIVYEKYLTQKNPNKTFKYISRNENLKSIFLFECSTDLNILLFGSTGAGKSTTGNYLLEKSDFEESDDAEPCTKICQNQSNTVLLKKYYQKEDHVVNINIKLNIFDTPGLNEPSVDEEIKNTIEIIRAINDNIKTLCTVLLCVKYDQKLDNQFVDSLNYYKVLLKDIFNRNNWGIVFTKMPYNVFQKYKNITEYCDKRREKLEQILNTRIPIFFVYNHYDRKLESFSEEIKQQMLYYFISQPIIDVTNLFYPLPPILNQIRLETLKSIDSNITTLNRAFKANAADICSDMDNIKTQFDQIEKLKDQTDTCVKLIHENLKTHYGNPSVRFGDDSVAINKAQTFILYPDREIYNYDILHDWNCEFNIEERDEKHIQIKVIPDTINIRKYKGHKWYFSICLNYPGDIYNISEIAELKSQVKENNKLIELHRENIKTIANGIDITNIEYEKNFDQYNEFYYLKSKIEKQEYSKTEIYDIFALLRTVYTKNISNINYKEYPDFDEHKIFKEKENEYTKNKFQNKIKNNKEKLEKLISSKDEPSENLKKV